MKNFRDTCIDFFTDESLKKDVREMMKPIFSMIYNEIYIYIWMIAFYNLFVVIVHRRGRHEKQFNSIAGSEHAS